MPTFIEFPFTYANFSEGNQTGEQPPQQSEHTEKTQYTMKPIVLDSECRLIKKYDKQERSHQTDMGEAGYIEA